MFAVRQWPGNEADLDFRGVIEGCTAAVVVASPIEDSPLSTEHNYLASARPKELQEFKDSGEYREVAKVLPFCRLWCVPVVQSVTF